MELRLSEGCQIQDVFDYHLAASIEAWGLRLLDRFVGVIFCPVIFWACRYVKPNGNIHVSNRENLFSCCEGVKIACVRPHDVPTAILDVTGRSQDKLPKCRILYGT